MQAVVPVKTHFDKPPLNDNGENLKDKDEQQVKMSQSILDFTPTLNQIDQNQDESFEHDDEVEDGIDYELESQFQQDMHPNTHFLKGKIFNEMKDNHIQANHII